DSSALARSAPAVAAVPVAVPELRRGESRPSAQQRSRSLKQLLVGAALGIGATAGVMMGLGTKSSTQQPVDPNPGQFAVPDQRGQEWADRFGDKGPADLAQLIDQLEQAKKDADQKAAELAEASNAEKDRAEKAAEQARAAETKADVLEIALKRADAKAAQKAA